MEGSCRRNLITSKLIKFEESWAGSEDCRKILQDFWKEAIQSSPSNFNYKVQNSLKRMALWNKNRLKGSLKGAIERTERDIQKLNVDANNRDVVIAQERQLDKLLKEEE